MKCFSGHRKIVSVSQSVRTLWRGKINIVDSFMLMQTCKGKKMNVCIMYFSCRSLSHLRFGFTFGGINLPEYLNVVPLISMSYCRMPPYMCLNWIKGSWKQNIASSLGMKYRIISVLYYVVSDFVTSDPEIKLEILRKLRVLKPSFCLSYHVWWAISFFIFQDNKASLQQSPGHT